MLELDELLKVTEMKDYKTNILVSVRSSINAHPQTQHQQVHPRIKHSG